MVKENVMKQTEIGILPEDWNLEILSSISFLKGRIGWQGLNQTEFTENDNEPFLITGMNFKDGKIRWNEVYHVSEDRYEVAKDIQLKSDDVLMTKDGTIGKMLYVDNIPYPHKASLNSHLLVFRPKKNNYNPKYLYYNLQFKYFLNHIEENKSGTTFFGLSQGAVGKYKIPLPPIAEQEAIAAALSDADAWIESLEQLIAKKRSIKQGAMQELLSPKEDWEVKKLGEVIDVYRGGSPRPIQNYITEKLDGINWIKIGDTSSTGKYIISANEKIISEGEKNSRRVYPGDFLLSNSMSFGRPYILKIDGCIHDGWLVLQNYQKSFETEFLYYLLTSRYIIDQYKSKAAGSSVLNLNKELVNTVELLIPSLAEQSRIATILSDMDAELEALEAQLAKARQVKQGMMQELLTGRVRLV